MCPSTTSTCWDKFHQFYYPNALFKDKGNVRRHSKLAKLKDAHEPRSQAVRRPATACQIAYGADLGGAIDHALDNEGNGDTQGIAAFGVGGNAPPRLVAFGSGNLSTGLVAPGPDGDSRLDNRPGSVVASKLSGVCRDVREI
ncbi:hypothetical protein AM587_10000599 [Phytophthora nicotianae]|uniref:Uncharacterized protein n=1 Tax=Phytophthora nicotianae TaxID=4792 RepID=A0A0W8CUV5_PHYNI|nr:hypothetical protein AM587_10000599 [Phytophthora nicotianae]